MVTEAKQPKIKRDKRRQLIAAPDQDPDGAYPRVPASDDFGGDDFLQAKDLEAVGELLIDHYEGQFAHLRKARISYLWKRKGGARAGKIIQGKTLASKGLVRHFGGFDFVIWLAADHLVEATFFQIEAIVYHELNHIGFDEEEGVQLVGHDFEGFAKEVMEYGAWDERVKIMASAFRQMSLDEALAGRRA